MKQSSLSPVPPSKLVKTVEILLFLVATIFLVLHALHLKADFPNHSPWVDWAKYTDEGWYGDAAIRHFQLGHWYVPGDFNPAAALPVWPLLEAALFRFTGVNLVAARGLAFGTVWHVEEQGSERLLIELQADGDIGLLGRCLDDPAASGKVYGGDEVAGRIISQDAITDHDLLGALQNDAERRFVDAGCQFRHHRTEMHGDPGKDGLATYPIRMAFGDGPHTG